MIARINRIIGAIVIALGLGVIGFGVVFALFGWMNNGAAAGLGLLLVPGGFGAAAVAVGAAFYFVGRLHASNSRWRWWLQVLMPLMTAYVAFGLAAEFSVIVDRSLR